MADDLLQFYRGLWRPPFAGEIYEYGRKINLQGNYAVKGLFDVYRSRYLVDVFHSLKNPRVRMEVTMKAVQTGGSLTSDITIPYRIEHDPGGMLLLLQDDDFAKKICDTRLMPLLYSIPEIARMIAELPRHSRTKTEFLLPGMTLIVGGLNEGNVQSMSWRYVTLDEAWLAAAGLIGQAEARMTAFPYSSKFHLISQGGTENDDFDQRWELTNKKEWAWRCRECGKLNPTEWAVRRDDNSWAGMCWDTNERTRPNGKWRMSEVLPTVRLACRFCAGVIVDDPMSRRWMDDNSDYIITKPDALQRNSGHRWTSLANVDIPFTELVAEYLEAKYQDEEFNYKEPLKKFYRQRLARPWSDNVGAEVITLESTPYDPLSLWPDEAFRFCLVDCQKDFTKLYVLIVAWSKAGAVRELFWGCLENFELVAEKQQEFKVVDENVFVDIGYEQTRVAQECVKRGHFKQNAQGRNTWMCWKGLKGSDTDRFPHRVPKREPGTGKIIRDAQTQKPIVVTEYRIYSEVGYLNPNLGTGPKALMVPFFLWSNLHVKDICARYRDAKAGKVEWLKDQAKPGHNSKEDPESASAQMFSEFRKREVSDSGKKTNRWLQKGRRPNHKWDCWCMGIVAACRAEIIGGPMAQADQSDTSPPAPLPDRGGEGSGGPGGQ